MTQKEFEIISEALRQLKIKIENSFDSFNREIQDLYEHDCHLDANGEGHCNWEGHKEICINL